MRLPPDDGTAGLGSNVRLGEMEQVRTRLVGEASMLEVFMAETGLTVPEARTLLAKFGLVADHVHRPAGTCRRGNVPARHSPC